jgi:hypothetical protein
VVDVDVFEVKSRRRLTINGGVGYGISRTLLRLRRFMSDRRSDLGSA